MSSPRTHRVAVIPGDGIGIETVAATLKVLDKLMQLDGGFKFDYTHFDYGCQYIPWSGMQTGKQADSPFSCEI